MSREHAPENNSLPKIFRLPVVIEATGLSRSSIYAFVANGTFPQPVRLGARAVGWKESDLKAWLDSRHTAAIKSWVSK